MATQPLLSAVSGAARIQTTIRGTPNRLNYCVIFIECTWLDNKVRELATVCLPWQHWTKALVWFDDADISAFHSCVVVDL